jgi:hypothetical protein
MLLKPYNLFKWLKFKSFHLCTTGLWDYKGIIDQKKVIPSSGLTLELLSNHLKGEFPFQIIKPITFDNLSMLRQKLEAEFIDLHAFHLEK